MILKPETIERTGPTTDEIVAAVAEEYGVSESRLQVEVLEEAREAFLGFIGGSKARARVTVLPDPRDIADYFVHEVIATLNPEARCEIEEDDRRFIVYIEGGDVGNLIGKHGATLNALQYLANIVSNRYEGTPKVDVEVDVSGYRDSRTRSLQELSQRLAEKVIQTGRAVELEPMTAAERKVIHITLKEIDGIATYSTGNEPNRSIVIAPRGAGADGQAPAQADADGPKKRRRRRKPRNPDAPVDRGPGDAPPDDRD